MTAKRPYNQHGLNPLKSKVKARGMNAVDVRSRAAFEVEQRTAGSVTAQIGDS